MVAIFIIEAVEGVASVVVSVVAAAEEEKSESSVVFRLDEVLPTPIAMARIPEDKRQKRRTPTSHLCSTAGTSVFVVVDALVFSFIVTMF